MKLRTFEVYGEYVGFLGYIAARTESGAKRAARQLWPGIGSFRVTWL